MPLSTFLTVCSMPYVFLGLVSAFIALLLWPKEPEWKELAGFWLFLTIVTLTLFLGLTAIAKWITSL